MINIIREDSQINEQLTEFPKANLNISIFGTQSSGKSTLLNNVFGTKFPVLDTTVTRERCTKGVWFHNVNNFNVIDTEGFDSSERESEEKMYEKKVALFCLALSEVVIINMWMNEIGRYEASHSHILKAIIRASEMLIASQQRRIIFVVRDCTEDADRSILKEELHSHMMGIVKAQTQKSTMKFALEYFMMSHYYDEQKQFKKEAKELLKSISVTRKSSLSNYSNQDRLVYIKKLWEKVSSSQSEINLRTVEDALRNYALERIKRETIDHMEDWLAQIQDLSKHKTYARYKEATYKEARAYYLSRKPKHLKDTQVQNYIEAIYMAIESKQNKLFMTILLPKEEDRLIAEDYEAKLDAIQDTNAMDFKKQLEKGRKEIEQAYRLIVKGLREYAKMTRRFIDKIQTKDVKYEQFLQHISNLFNIELESSLNEEIDSQTHNLEFNPDKIRKLIRIIEEKHKTDSETCISQVWQRVSSRTSNSTIIQRIKLEGDIFSTASLGFLLGNQTEGIINYYRKLESKATSYLSNLLNFNCSDDETTVNLQKFQQIQKVICDLMDQKLAQQSRRFKITLILVGLLMYLFYSEFKLLLSVFGMSKKRLRRWIWLYMGIMLSIFGVLIFRNKDYFKKFIEPI